MQEAQGINNGAAAVEPEEVEDAGVASDRIDDSSDEMPGLEPSASQPAKPRNALGAIGQAWSSLTGGGGSATTRSSNARRTQNTKQRSYKGERGSGFMGDSRGQDRIIDQDYPRDFPDPFMPPANQVVPAPSQPQAGPSNATTTSS